PGEDIEIRVTGLRPGEKLFEELRFAAEDVVPTYHDKIKIFRSSILRSKDLMDWLQQLDILLRHRDPEQVKAHLLTLVPEYLGSSPRQQPIANGRPAPVGNPRPPLVLQESALFSAGQADA
ncbi:MAG: polysaccharide biosynthesis protein, partial [Acidobacteriaceae bacterium]|nr:polysaccharide biosynthesis protein [Acidobacteriaceae bacterium]